MQLLNDYFKIQKQLYEYFGYEEKWKVFPLDDSTQYYWMLDGEGPGKVHFADTITELAQQTGNYYENVIYTQRHLKKWVYRGKDYTMVVVDTQTDGNKFLQIFDNSKEFNTCINLPLPHPPIIKSRDNFEKHLKLTVKNWPIN